MVDNFIRKELNRDLGDLLEIDDSFFYQPEDFSNKNYNDKNGMYPKTNNYKESKKKYSFFESLKNKIREYYNKLKN
ncbi:MAG: hypothetical protein WC393_00445 [Candidatus Nanoarchaeia archaeon]|jgi:Zn-finger nucleic acid-binding protein